MADKKKIVQSDGDEIKITLSVLSTVLAVVIVAACCTSSSKGANEVFSPPLEAPTAPTSPSEYTNGENIGFFWSDTDSGNTTNGEEADRETDGGVTAENDKTTLYETEKNKDNTNTSVAKKDPEREYYDEERFIGGYKNNGVSIEISKVENGELNYFICDIKVSDPSQLKTAFAGGRIKGRLFTSKIASSVGAAFAVNGDFCGFRTEGIIIRDGVLYRNKKAGWDLLCLDKNGDLVTYDNDSVDGNDLVRGGVLQSWCFGPTLVKDGKALTTFNTPNLSKTAKEPRTAIGQVGKLHYIILVVDAVRTSTKTEGGMSFAQLASEFERLGCTTAYNLDGGGSTTLYFNGNVINDPCVSGERQVSDIIYLK